MNIDYLYTVYIYVCILYILCMCTYLLCILQRNKNVLIEFKFSLDEEICDVLNLK